MISDTKVSKITQKPLFYKAFTVWDFDAVGSNPATPTKSRKQLCFRLVFYYLYHLSEITFLHQTVQKA